MGNAGASAIDYLRRMDRAITQTDLPFPVRRGKVRDVYDLGDTLLIIATDRISAFDCILPTGIPGKGKLLTAMSRFWFDRLGSLVPNHLIAMDAAAYPAALAPFAELLAGRSMLVKKAAVVPIECVARGYLAGSGWLEYQSAGTVCGVPLPTGLRLADRLPAPIFTPATKAESGHDENISFEQMCSDVGQETAAQLRDLTLSVYNNAAAYAADRGIIIADTKFEFGRLPDGQIILIDEVLTPDSSRFWPVDTYAPGQEQASFDKQFVRNYLNGLDWDKRPPAPTLPEEVVQGTLLRYREALERLIAHPSP